MLISKYLQMAKSLARRTVRKARRRVFYKPVGYRGRKKLFSYCVWSRWFAYCEYCGAAVRNTLKVECNVEAPLPDEPKPFFPINNGYWWGAPERV